MESPPEFTGPVNLGNPAEFTIKELAELVIAETGAKSQLTNLPLPQDDPKQRCPDITLAKRVLQWSPKVPLSEGIRPTIEYFRVRPLLNWLSPRAVSRSWLYLGRPGKEHFPPGR